MMGTKARLLTPLPSLSLEELIPADHFYRHVDRVLDLSFVRDLVQGCYAVGLGRPSVDPVVFFRLQLVMFFEGIRSERQLLRLAHGVDDADLVARLIQEERQRRAILPGRFHASVNLLDSLLVDPAVEGREAGRIHSKGASNFALATSMPKLAGCV